ncbi:MAG: hypothetical protein MI742_01645 [Desulfobacterales bacterium]|nr:hypothetical protein [Desulfobacterales bacterium]
MDRKQGHVGWLGRFKKAGWGAVCFFFYAFLLVGVLGCDEENAASRIEDARMAIDDGNYQTALKILEKEAGTSEVLEIRASAYAGQVGINTFDILAQLDDEDDSNDGSIDRIGSLLGAESSGRLACSEIASRLSLMDQAVTAIGGATVNNDNKVKLGIYGFTDFILSMGEILCRNYGTQMAPPNAVTFTEAWIRSLRGTIGGSFSAVQVETDELTRFGQDIGYAKNAAMVLGPTNDLGDEFQRFLGDIDPNGDGSVSQSEFAAFLNNL